MIAPVTVAFTITGGPLDPLCWRVTRASVSEGLSILGTSVIDLATPDPDADPLEILGRDATLVLHRGEVCRKIHGCVRRAEDLGMAEGSRHGRVWLVPTLWVLSQRRDTRVFEGLTAIDVVEAVLRDAGLYDGRIVRRLRGVFPPRERCVQHDETDLDFVQRLLEAEGVAWHTASDGERETLVLTDHPEAHLSFGTLGGATVPLVGEGYATAPVESVRRFVPAREVHSASAIVDDHDFTRPALDNIGHSARSDGSLPRGTAVRHTRAEGVVYDYATPAYRSSDVQRQADLRADAVRAEARVFLAETAMVGAHPGGVFALSAPGHPDWDERYLVVGAQHDVTAHHGMDGVDYVNRLRCVSAGVTWRPQRVTPRPTVAGVQTATVIGPPGEDIHTDEHGRIRVRFHWDRRTDGVRRDTCWIRVMQPWAGAGWGVQFIPRVGMEVLVDFVDGHPDRPVVLGCVHDGHHPPGFDLPEHRTHSGIRTRSTPDGTAGNELSFEDTSGAERLMVHAQRDLVVSARHDHRSAIARDETHSVGRDRQRTVGRHDRTVVHGNQNVEINRDQNVTVSGKASRHVVHGVHEHVEHGRETRIVDGDVLEVCSGGRSVVVQAGDHDGRVHGDRRDQITGAWDTVAEARWSVRQGPTRLTMERGQVTCAAEGAMTLVNGSGAMRVGVDDGVMTLTAARTLRLQCGSASLVLNSDGTIGLHAPGGVTMTAGHTRLALDDGVAELSAPRVLSAAVGVYEIAGALIKIG